MHIDVALLGWKMGPRHPRKLHPPPHLVDTRAHSLAWMGDRTQVFWGEGVVAHLWGVGILPLAEIGAAPTMHLTLASSSPDSGTGWDTIPEVRCDLRWCQRSQSQGAALG